MYMTPRNKNNNKIGREASHVMMCLHYIVEL